MWVFEGMSPETLAESGAEVLIVPNGSPFELDKPDGRITHAVARVTEPVSPLLYVNSNLRSGRSGFPTAAPSFSTATVRWPRKCRVAVRSPGHVVAARETGAWICEPTAAHAAARPLETSTRQWLGLRDYVTKTVSLASCSASLAASDE